MTTLCLCDVNEHDLRVFAEIASAGRMSARPVAPLGGGAAGVGRAQPESTDEAVPTAGECNA